MIGYNNMNLNHKSISFRENQIALNCSDEDEATPDSDDPALESEFKET
jgi:hypothetical protein